LIMQDPLEARFLSKAQIECYAGRWVAYIKNRIVGHGGTPAQALRAGRLARPKEHSQVIFVPMVNPLVFSAWVERVVEALPPDLPIYLVGGSVRDALLGRQIHDLDFVLEKEVFRTARRTADKLGGAFYPLDEERQTARVVVVGEGDRRQFIDFAAFRGPDLESDLQARDFTINAMAVNVHKLSELMDPLGGARDLHQKLLRACHPNSLNEDPARILRGIRLAAAYNLHIVPETRQLMRASIPLLPKISSERFRDELFRILEGPQPAASLRALKMLGVFSQVLPEIALLSGVDQSPPHVSNVWDHTLGVLQKLEEILSILKPEYDHNSASNLMMGLASIHLGRFRRQIGDHLSQSINPDRSARGLLFMAALYHDIAKPETRQVDEDGRIRFLRHEQVGAEIVLRRAKALHLSNNEAEHLSTVVRHHLRPKLLSQSADLATPRAIYRFFRDTGSAGVDICLLTLADVLATYGTTLPDDIWTRDLSVVRTLLEAWWENNEKKVSPSPLLNGKDLIDIFNLFPGPQIGALLESLREAQAVGKVHTRDEALEFIQKALKEN
jgi:putative nucleotidyltransferase with HDIG domain